MLIYDAVHYIRMGNTRSDVSRTDGPTVIYHVGHYGFLWRFLAHKVIYHPKESALFLINEGSYSKETREFIHKQKEDFSFFGKMCIFKESFQVPLTPEDDIEGKICELFDPLLSESGCDLGSCEVYSGFDVTCAFTTYLSIREKKFTLCGMEPFKIANLNRYNEMIILLGPPAYCSVLVTHRALTWDNKFVSKVIWFKAEDDDNTRSSTPEISKPSEAIDCDALMDLMSQSHRAHILSFFNMPALDNGCSTMMICSSRWVIWIVSLTDREYYRIYAQIADYFLESSDGLIIKPHPNGDSPDQWAFFFPDCPIIRGYIPSQLLRFVPNLTPRNIISTSGGGISKAYAQSTTYLTPGSLHGYNVYHKIFIALSMIRTLGRSVRIVVRLYNLTDFATLFIERLFPDLKELLNTPEHTADMMVKIVDDAFCPKDYSVSKDVKDKQMIICLNSQGNHMSDLNVLQYALPMHIRKHLTKPDPKEADEMLMVYVKNKKVHEDLKKYSQSYELVHSGMRIEVGLMCHYQHFDSLASIVSNNFGKKPVILISMGGSSLDYEEEILSMLGIGAYVTFVHGSGDYAHAINEYVIFGIGYDLKEASELIWRFKMRAFSDYLLMDNHILGRLPRNNVDGDLDLAIAMRHMDEKNIEKAIRWMRMAMERGSKTAMGNLAGLLLERLSEGDVEEACSILSKQAEENNGEAMITLGRMHRDGLHVTRSTDEAISWMTMAAEAGIARIGNELVDLLAARSSPAEQKRAYDAFLKLAEGGNGEAMGVLGKMHFEGVFVEPDIDKGIAWMRRSTKKNVPWAKVRLINWLLKRGSPDDLYEAHDIAIALAKEGNGEAMMALGRMHRDGLHVTRSTDEAISWMTMAVEAGIARIGNELVDLLAARSSPAEQKRAYDAFLKLAEGGNGEAMGALGKMYYKGVYVEANTNKGIEWLKKSSKKNVKWAQRELSRLEASK